MAHFTMLITALISWVSLLAGAYWAFKGVYIAGVAQSAMHEIYDGITILCAIVCFGIFGVISIINAHASEVQKNRASMQSSAAGLEAEIKKLREDIERLAARKSNDESSAKPTVADNSHLAGSVFNAPKKSGG